MYDNYFGGSWDSTNQSFGLLHNLFIAKSEGISKLDISSPLDALK
jgi:hypothetical protein